MFKCSNWIFPACFEISKRKFSLVGILRFDISWLRNEQKLLQNNERITTVIRRDELDGMGHVGVHDIRPRVREARGAEVGAVTVLDMRVRPCQRRLGHVHNLEVGSPESLQAQMGRNRPEV